jgi:hypothetical protein
MVVAHLVRRKLAAITSLSVQNSAMTVMPLMTTGVTQTAPIRRAEMESRPAASSVTTAIPPTMMDVTTDVILSVAMALSKVMSIVTTEIQRPETDVTLAVAWRRVGTAVARHLPALPLRAETATV